MATHRGTLLELVARGKKDAFFTTNPKTAFFHGVYARAAPFTEEVYVAAPRNAAEWGRWVEFDLEHRGDLVRKFYLRLRLPTWLPPSLAAINGRSVVTDSGGITFGYCNNVGFQVIDRIQVFQDQVMIQELYGEYLDWRLRQSNILAATLVTAAQVGSRGDTTLDVGRAATPGLLRVPLPMLGWEAIGDPGFPMAAMRGQRFRVRILLRRIEDVIVASDGRLKPAPWSLPLRVQTSRGGPVDTTTYTSLPYEATAKGIEVGLETTQVYVGRDIQEWLRVQRWRIPYRNSQRHEFNVADNQMAAAATVSVTNFTLPFLLDDFVGPASRLLVGVQRQGDRLAGDRGALFGDAVRQWRLSVSNIDRIIAASRAFFRDVVPYWKNVRAPSEVADPTTLLDIATFTFGGCDTHHPSGTFNFTRAVAPTLFATFAAFPVDTRTMGRDLFVVTYLETYRVWEIQEGKGKVLVDE
jgi:hypothetical protein